MKLNIYAEVAGQECLAGAIQTEPGFGESFRYEQAWLESASARPLSLSLPLSAESFDAKRIRPYFEGLLPEGTVRESVAKAMRVSPNSYLRLLSEIGWECIGALSVHGDSPRPRESYAPMSQDDLDELSHVVSQQGAWLEYPTRLSLAGAQPKSALYRSIDGTWYKPGGGAPSTHVLKPTTSGFEGVAINEALCCMAASCCKIHTVQVEILPTEVPMLCSERYDRTFEHAKRAIDGLKAPCRLHQEDFCQASGILSEHKYEEGNSAYLTLMSDLIRRESTEPRLDLQELWRRQVFDYLIGNCDAHLKNKAVLRSADWKQLRLAPAYDLICTCMYPNLSRKLAVGIGPKRDIDKIQPDDFLRQAADIDISRTWAMDTAFDLAKHLIGALDVAATELERCEVEDVARFHAAITSSCKERCDRITG